MRPRAGVLIEDVTVTKAADRRILAQVRFRGGATETMQVDAPLPTLELFAAISTASRAITIRPPCEVMTDQLHDAFQHFQGPGACVDVSLPQLRPKKLIRGRSCAAVSLQEILSSFVRRCP